MTAPSKIETKHFTLGKGKVRWQSGNAYTNKFRELGNAPQFDVSMEIEKIEHYDAMNGTNLKDWELYKQIKAKGQLVLEDVNINNMQIFLLGSSIAEITQASGMAATKALVAVHDIWQKLGVYNITNAILAVFSPGDITAGGGNSGTAVLGTPTLGASVVAGTYTITYDTDHYVLTDPNDVVVPLSGTGPYTSSHIGFSVASGTPSDEDEWTCLVATSNKTAGTDYEIDTTAGWIRTFTTGTIVDGAPLLLTYDKPAKTLYSVNVGESNANVGHLHFVGDPKAGQIEDLEGYCNLTPNGNKSFITDEICKITLDVEFLAHAQYGGKLAKFYNRGAVLPT